MLKRKFYGRLLEWKGRKEKKPLLVKGARQVGKTYLLEHFGKREYASYLYVNFMENPAHGAVFGGALDPKSRPKRP